MSTPDVSLVLVNANVLTMDEQQPCGEAVAVNGERVAEVGSNSDVRRLTSTRTQVIDCQGLTLLPGFNDAHCHLPGLARRLQDLDCSPERAPSVALLQALVREWASTRPSGSWVRGYGYDDRQMEEGRHPTRWDLDIASPEHPAWLEHRSGHAAVLNSLGLGIAGIHRETPEPPGGVVERDFGTGEPTGVLFEMRPFLRERLGNLRSAEEFDCGMRAAGQLLCRYGVTSVQDAGADNGIERWRTFQRLRSDGALSCRVTMFAGAKHLAELGAEGLRFGSGDGRSRVGHAKIVLTLTSRALHPSTPELAELVAEAHGRGFPVAIHCVEEEAIAVAAGVLYQNRRSKFVDRIEHCSEGTPLLVNAVQKSGAAVVTNPGFVYHHGAAYRENVEQRLLPHLYPAGALHRAGVAVAFGSDAPVIDPNPWKTIYSAVTRRASDRRPLSSVCEGEQAVEIREALRMYTKGAAEVEGTSEEKGSIAPRKVADMVLVDANPLSSDPEELREVKTMMTMVGGRVVWSNI